MNSKNKNRRPRKGQNKRRAVRKHPENGNLVVRDSPRFPNDVKQVPIHNRVIRYVAVNAITKALTPALLLRQIIATTNASATAIRVIGCVRLRRMSFYYVPTTGDFGSSTNVLSFTWNGDLNSPDNVITDRGTATQPACIKVKPIKDSAASFWYDNNSPNVNNTICTFTVPATSVIDIEFDYTLGNGTTGTVTLSGAATTTGLALLELDSDDIIPDGGVTRYKT